MTLIGLNPLCTGLAAAKDRFNRLFGRDELSGTDALVADGDWAPAVDILEADRGITIKVELPGVETNDVSICVDNNVLTLKGERRAQKEIKKENCHRMERAFGTFCSSFALPAVYIDIEKIKADFSNGLLTITLPKKASAKGPTSAWT